MSDTQMQTLESRSANRRQAMQLEARGTDKVTLALLNSHTQQGPNLHFRPESKHNLHLLPTEKLLGILVVDSFELLSSWIIVDEVVELRSSSSSELVRCIRPV